MRFLILMLVASACIVQVRAELVDKIRDKVEGVKDLITGGGGDDKSEKEEVKQEEAKQEEKSYRGGALAQVGHAMVDAGADRLAVELQDKLKVPMSGTVAKLAMGHMKKMIHNKINEIEDKKAAAKQGAEPAKLDGQEQAQSEQSAEPSQEGEQEQKKNLLAGLIDKVVKSRKKRSTSSEGQAPVRGNFVRRFISRIKSIGKPWRATGPREPVESVQVQPKAQTEVAPKVVAVKPQVEAEAKPKAEAEAKPKAEAEAKPKAEATRVDESKAEPKVEQPKAAEPKKEV